MSARAQSKVPFIPVQPMALILTRDAALLERIRSTSVPPWDVEACVDSRFAREALGGRSVRLVVIDDGALADNERGWLIDQVRYRVPEASIVYVASEHSPELERTIRARGVLTYTARPLDTERLDQVLRAAFRRGAA